MSTGPKEAEPQGIRIENPILEFELVTTPETGRDVYIADVGSGELSAPEPERIATPKTPSIGGILQEAKTKGSTVAPKLGSSEGGSSTACDKCHMPVISGEQHECLQKAA